MKRIPTLSQARKLGEEGLAAATQHSLFENPDWMKHAIEFFEAWCRSNDEVVMELVTLTYLNSGNPPPASEQAMGQLVKIGKRKGWLAKDPVRMQARRRGHGAPAPVWRSLIYDGRMNGT